MIVFYDFETTGFVDKRSPLSSPKQPHIVQAAAIVADDAGREVASFCLICRPDGWTIPEASAAVHGIDTERAARFGVPETSIYRLIVRFMRLATMRVAHNESFDCDILKIAAHRSDDDDMIELLEAMPAFCTMESTRNVCRIPPTERMVVAGIMDFKSPKLEEAYLHIFGEPLAGAHDAMNDVRAARRIYEHLNSTGSAAA